MILGSKTFRDQLNIDVMEGLRAKALGHGKFAESEHGLDAVHSAGSAVTIGVRRVTLSLGAIQTIADAKEPPDAVKDSFVEELLPRESGMGMDSEIDWVSECKP